MPTPTTTAAAVETVTLDTVPISYIFDEVHRIMGFESPSTPGKMIEL